MPPDLEQKMHKLLAKNKVLQNENEMLSERAEESLLINLITESLRFVDKRSDLLDSLLERISIIKSIPYCTCCELNQDSAVQIKVYTAFSDTDYTGREIKLQPAILRQLKDGVCHITQGFSEEKHFQISLDEELFKPVSAIIFPFSSKLIPQGIFLFLDDQLDENKLKTCTLLLQNIINMAVEKMGKIALIDELKELNSELDRKVKVRTASLLEANKLLEAQVRERKQAELKLQSLREYLSSIIDSMPSMLVGVDADGMISLWNKRVEEFTGTSPESAIGKSLTDLYSEILPQKEMIHQSIASQEVKKERNKYIKTEEGDKYLDITVYPLSTDELEGAVIRIDDVTREHDMEEQLNHRHRMESIGQLAGGIAHDFNNMLSGIMGAAELLQITEINMKEEGVQYVEMIQQSVSRAADLTAKLLAFSRKGETLFKAVDIASVIDDTLAIIKRTADKNITLTVKKEAENHVVIGDYTALQSAFMNLGINAVHSMPDGGVIHIQSKNTFLNKEYCDNSSFDIESGEYVEIMVQDSGVGISQDNIRKIFEPFFTTKKQGAGTGLGLAAVYGTVQNHHGAINVYSKEGVGSVFHIFLPCSQERAVVKEVNTEIVMGSGLILLADDEELIRKAEKKILQTLGYEVLVAENGLEAVKLFKEKKKLIDVILMDMMMPRMNGREAFHKIKEIDNNCKVIIASGYIKDVDLDELREAGIKGFIKKPFETYKLSQLLAQTLKSGI